MPEARPRRTAANDTNLRGAEIRTTKTQSFAGPGGSDAEYRVTKRSNSKGQRMGRTIQARTEGTQSWRTVSPSKVKSSYARNYFKANSD